MKIFKNTLQVKEADIDRLNHVNNKVYLQWINNISTMHWQSVSNAEINAAYVWVVARHEIDYLKPAFLNENITIKTWIDSLKGVKSMRKVAIYRDNTLLAKSTTTWVLLDAKTHKITRIPQKITDLFGK